MLHIERMERILMKQYTPEDMLLAEVSYRATSQWYFYHLVNLIWYQPI